MERQASTFGIGAGAGAGNTTGRPERGTLADVRGAYNDVYTGRGTEVIATGRTSLVVDPPNGLIPYLPGARARWQAERPRVTDDMADGPEQRTNDRCMGVQLPLAYGQAVTAGGHKRIVQTPGHVAVYYEHGHHGGAYRDVPLDGRRIRRRTSDSGSGMPWAAGKARRSSSRRGTSRAGRATRAQPRT